MRNKAYPKISFGIIVLNGEPFTRYCLKSLYPFAHEIIVVEGANKSAASISTDDGHSIDGTLENLYRFKEEEDSENKVQIVTKNGFWSEKDEQSKAYAERANGDYLWQIDIDEFYKPEDMETILCMLRENPEISTLSFKQITFWGGFDYIVDSWYLRRGADICHRLFKWGNGYHYITHRPPTVHNSENKDLRTLKWVNGYELEKRGIYLYHYSLVFPKQVREKCEYYSSAEWAEHAKKAREWAENDYMKLKNPYRVHNVYNYPSWLMRYKGKHPSAIQQMKKDIERGELSIETRESSDVEKLLNSKRYRLGSISF
jgi:hypothetical protein